MHGRFEVALGDARKTGQDASERASSEEAAAVRARAQLAAETKVGSGTNNVSHII